MGLLAKPMIVTLPFLLILLDYWPLERLNTKSQFARRLLEKTPFFLLAAASCIVTYHAQQAGGAVAAMQGDFTLSHRIANAAVAYGRYLGKTFVPIDLAVFYPMPAHWPADEVAGAAALLVVVTALALWNARRRPYLLVGWFWFVGSLMPVIGLLQVGEQSLADRYTYLPCIGPAIALCWAGRELAAKFPWRGECSGRR